MASAAFRMTSAHDFVAGAVLLKHGFRVKLRFLISKCNPLRRSRVSIARNAGKIAFSDFEV